MELVLGYTREENVFNRSCHHVVVVGALVMCVHVIFSLAE